MKDFDRHLFFDKVKSIRNSEEWFGRWYEAVAIGHVPRCVLLRCYLIRNSASEMTYIALGGALNSTHPLTSSKLRKTSLGKSWKHTTLWFPGGSCHYRWWSSILVTTAMTQPPPSIFFPPSSLRLLPLPLFNEGLGVSPWENCAIKDVCRYVLENFDGLMRLIIFPWNKKVNFPPHFLISLSPEDFRDAFCVVGVPVGAPCCGESEGVTMILQSWGHGQGIWGT